MARSRWREGHLRARLARGELTREALETASWAGDEVAARIAGTFVVPPGLDRWLRGFALWGRPGFCRALAGVARTALPRLGPLPTPVAALLLGMEVWLDHPCPGCLERIDITSRRLACGPGFDPAALQVALAPVYDATDGRDHEPLHSSIAVSLLTEALRLPPPVAQAEVAGHVVEALLDREAARARAGMLAGLSRPPA